jgi:cyclic beta-1,2-glucan synthetase
VKRALETVGWDGEWYRRGSFDDGAMLGSKQSDECKIDSIAQSWSVLSGQGDETRSRTAMASVSNRLVDEKLKIIRLFTPPFNRTRHDPGYIKSYPPGVRENGGQYTHAATWVVAAFAELGLADEAYKCFSLINPVQHALDREAAEQYRVEPYVVAADIYGEGEKGGRGGWTWYTGSAGWLYRAAVEFILGIRRQGDRIIVKPALPSHWEGFTATLAMDGTKYRIRVERARGAKSLKVSKAGKAQKGEGFELGGKGEIEVLVQVPG